MSEREEKRRPDRTTMHGMIWNANHVLDVALDPKTKGVPRSFFERCRGVVLISVVEAGFIFSGSIGTGVVLSRDRRRRRWSPPSAVALAGMGFGLIAGADAKDVIIVLMDDVSMRSVAGETQVKFGAQMSVAVGPVGREVEGQFNVSDHGPGVAFSWSFSRGLFAGVSFEGAILEARTKDNERFYGREGLPPSEILLNEDWEDVVRVPEGSGVPELWEKLELLQAGKTRVPTPAELERKESMRAEAEEAGRAAKAEQGDSVRYVDAKEEAEEEGDAAEGKEAEESDDTEKEKAKKDDATEPAATEE